ncbi:MAG: peptidylprolyl isomerase [SAR202 cluster bacterium]|nr:peptidylprolyl isomerase [SAR202 cluster bacterium]MDP6512038.1 peptidylprolyl isomerase [SAR202 cluster bacterium]MDP6715076.1 peptidylprolyl isomerase [SAR202 cluster bacterium]
MKRWNTRYLLAAALIILTVAALACSSDDEESEPAAAPAAPASAPAPAPAPAPSSAPKQWDSPPAMAIDTSKSYTAFIELEKGGEIEIELHADKVPNTVNNFVFLAREGFYDGVTFHRVLEGFMAQSGDPTGTGAGGPGYRFDNEFHADLRHTGPGILSMANAGIRNGEGTNGSQFFITFIPTPPLDGLLPDGTEKPCSLPGVSCHSVFGQVANGMDVVNNISLRDPGSARTKGDVIKTIRIEES